METKPIKVLLVEDSLLVAREMHGILKDATNAQFELVYADRLSAALRSLGETKIDVILLDLMLYDSRGFDTFLKIYRGAPKTPIVILTSLEDEDLAFKSVQEGAQDYLVKGQVDDKVLLRALRYAIERKKTEEALKKARRDLEIERGELKKANEGIKILYKELEQKNEQLKKLDELKSDFVSTVSHELRTPLSIMKEGISLILDGITGPTNENQKKMLNTVYANINRLTKIINDLLDISKIEAGRVELKKSLVDISELVKDISEKWRMASCKKEQDLEILLPHVPVSIYIDTDKIIQALNNLLSNAIKYTPAHGKITVELKDKETEVGISISDTGIGISKEDLPKVFSKFQQFSRVPGPGEKGTGLGLAIAKELIQMHQGGIEVESELNKGTKFTFSLPKMDSEAVFKEHINNGIREVAERNSPLLLLVIRFPEFYQIQKEFGFEKSQNLLRDIEKAVSNPLRRRTDTVVRNAGELIILLFDTARTDAVAVSRRIEEAIRTYLAESKEDMIRGMHFTIGAATYPEEAITDEELLNKARSSA